MKRLAILFSLIFIFSTCACSMANNNPKGDVNQNGGIDMTDYILVKRAYFGTYKFNNEQISLGDCNENGSIDMTDYILLKRAYFGTYDLGSNDSGSSENTESSEVSDTQSRPLTYVENIDNILGNTVNRDMNKKNILLGMSYTASVKAHTDYPDSKNILTDGVMPLSFSSDGKWAGYVLMENETMNIVVDMGKSMKNIMDLTVRSLDLEAYGIYAPKTVSVYISGDGNDYIRIGTAYRPENNLSQDAYRDYALYLQGDVEARYIRFEITASKKGWCFIGEVTAMAYSEAYGEYSQYGSSLNDYYGYEGIPVIETEEYWPDGNDFDTEQNLLSKKKAIISAAEYADNSLITEWYNTKNTALFTDGRKAAISDIGDRAWFHITHGGTRVITIDLQKISSVNGFSAGFLYDSSAGVQYPANVKVKLSLNGKDWQTVFKGKDIFAESEEEIYRYEESFGKEYKARYFQISFNVNTHTYIDEITATGKKNTANAANLIPDTDEEEKIVYDGFAMPEDLCDVHNMLLSYHCLLDSEKNSDESGLITKDEYLPYVAYLDENGNIKDTFFDAYLYLPYTNLIHGANSDYGRSADGWRAYIDDMFYPHRNMDALEECAEAVYSTLGKEDEKLKVFTSILYTYPRLYDGSKNPFGDIDGDGTDEDLSNFEDRKKAIKWIMDEELRRFNNNNYKNLEFCGYYWFEEGINYSDPHEQELIKFAVDYAHELGYKIFWIPYRSAAGVKDWAKLGFDAACLQPNYMFNDISANVLYDTAKRASDLGMCVELEINDPQNIHEANKFTEYLIAGAETGYMNAIKMYYQVGVPGAFHTACYSQNPETRAIYDNTYLFAKEKFDPIGPEDVIISQSDLVFEYTANTQFEGKIDVSRLSEISGSLTVTLSPKYGSIQLNDDGSFIYFPAKDHNGNDSFEIAFDLGYGKPISTHVDLICKG